MDLILWRHVDAERGGRDEERKLTAKGRRRAKHVAAWLRETAAAGHNRFDELNRSPCQKNFKADAIRVFHEGQGEASACARRGRRLAEAAATCFLFSIPPTSAQSLLNPHLSL